ncbi:DUF4880 domain-containing protein, partial [Pseudomonas aeruginosa]|uniref:FecR/PupR family sigma factor regulator n=1 Tax=Pseudomonas aeruginosa TaxID=287 RepID=UPI001889E815
MNDRASSRAPQAGDTELSGPPAAEAIAPQVLRETASWLLLMQEGPLAPAQQAELESWRSRSPEHQGACLFIVATISRLDILEMFKG